MNYIKRDLFKNTEIYTLFHLEKEIVYCLFF